VLGVVNGFELGQGLVVPSFFVGTRESLGVGRWSGSAGGYGRGMEPHL